MTLSTVYVFLYQRQAALQSSINDDTKQGSWHGAGQAGTANCR